jgi:hypothetical protein
MEFSDYLSNTSIAVQEIQCTGKNVSKRSNDYKRSTATIEASPENSQTCRWSSTQRHARTACGAAPLVGLDPWGPGNFPSVIVISRDWS